MFVNVWRVIWPNQRTVIANAVATAGGEAANPAAAGAARRAFLASRTNVVMSFPMLFFMGAASHFTLNPAGNRGLDRKSTRLNSSHGYISYAVFCLNKKCSST